MTCSNQVAPTLGNIRSCQGACRFCSNGGFRVDEPGTLYLFRHDGHRALKIGITNRRTSRLRQHEAGGWNLVDLWFFDVGRGALTVEQKVLTEWRAYETGVMPADMPQGGYTETVGLADMPEDEAIALIEEAIAAL